MTTATLTVDVHLHPADLAHTLERDVRAGLRARPKTLPPKWFYDERGSRLFDEITRLPEYYPTRRETEILEARAGEIAVATGAWELVELGSGMARKTRLLLDALRAAGRLRRFVPVDVSEDVLRSSGAALASEYDGLTVHGVVADFERHLDQLPPGEQRLVAFLGGTIGNLVPAQRARFLSSLAAELAPGEWLLLGTDLVKDRRRLVAAYDDAAGVTAAFNRNVLHVINRELDADFEPARFAHVALWDSDNEWIEMRLRSAGDQHVRVERLDLEVDFYDGEELCTEISAKFRRDAVEAELATAGFEPVRWWTDEAGDFAVTLARRVS